MTLNSIKNALFAAMHGMTPEEYNLQKARDNLKGLTDDFLAKHPEIFKTEVTPKATINKRIKKSLGADSRPVVSHTADHQDPYRVSQGLIAIGDTIDPELLARAKKAARDLAAADPERYGNVIKQQGAE
ncbi:hypothetical protein [Leclercia adecarboxylata]|uniref:hypothetical protein n=1 Tax=Leclercia adecarboxylata TaxID=83655 RepID=UPI00244BB04D|nr:hypothetical protein [Leclercia adecarboxylata]MDH0060788.1 hypothetical protein [Leclercia adecarboxylata]